MKFIKALFATALFGGILILVYYVHVNFLRVNVVFYAAIADSIIAGTVSGAILWLARYFSIFNNFEKLLLVVIWLISGYSAAISVPTVIDRSLSFYILEKIQQRGGGIRHDAFEDVFTKEYVKEHRLVDVRLTEQLESGTIIIIGDCVQLTEKGRRLARFSRYFRKNWLPKKRLLMGDYVDDLTDPFRHSEKKGEYVCH